MNFIICFIDDSDFEHALVREEIAPSAKGVEFVQAYTFEEARHLLGERIPLVFLLDLWGQDPDIKAPSIPPLAEIQQSVSTIPPVQDVYSGLEASGRDCYNEYLRRLFSIVESWRSVFRDAADRVGQNRKYGLENLRKAREFYPGVPAVFYTRKSMIDDAVELFRAGADGLFIKPTGRDETETRMLTRNFAPKLLSDLFQAIDRSIEKVGMASIPSSSHRASPRLLALMEAWKKSRTSESGTL